MWHRFLEIDPPRRISELKLSDVHLTPTSIAREQAKRLVSGEPPYVRRFESLDNKLPSSVETANQRLIVITGPSTNGKTRSAYEFIRRIGLDHWLLIAPRKPNRTDPESPIWSLAREQVVPADQGIVVWLDDLHDHLAWNTSGEADARPGLTYSLIDSLRSRYRNLVLIATLDSSRRVDQKVWSDIREQPFVSPLSLERRLPDKEWAEALENYDLEVTERARHLAEYLIGGPALLDNLNEARSEKPLAYQLVSAMIHAKRLGLQGGFSRQQVHDLTAAETGQYVPADELSAAIEWARSPVAETSSLVLPPLGEDAPPYDVLPYVVLNAEVDPVPQALYAVLMNGWRNAGWNAVPALLVYECLRECSRQQNWTSAVAILRTLPRSIETVFLYMLAAYLVSGTAQRDEATSFSRQATEYLREIGQSDQRFLTLAAFTDIDRAFLASSAEARRAAFTSARDTIRQITHSNGPSQSGVARLLKNVLTAAGLRRQPAHQPVKAEPFTSMLDSGPLGMAMGATTGALLDLVGSTEALVEHVDREPIDLARLSTLLGKSSFPPPLLAASLLKSAGANLQAGTRSLISISPFVLVLAGAVDPSREEPAGDAPPSRVSVDVLCAQIPEGRRVVPVFTSPATASAATFSVPIWGMSGNIVTVDGASLAASLPPDVDVICDPFTALEHSDSTEAREVMHAFSPTWADQLPHIPVVVATLEGSVSPVTDLETSISLTATEPDSNSIIRENLKRTNVFGLGRPAGKISRGVIGTSGSESDILHFSIDEDGKERVMLPVFTRPAFLRDALLRQTDWQSLDVIVVNGASLIESADPDVTIVIDPWTRYEYQVKVRGPEVVGDLAQLESVIAANRDQPEGARAIRGQFERTAIYALGHPAGEVSTSDSGMTGTESDLLHFTVDDGGVEKTILPVFTRPAFIRQALLRNAEWQALSVLSLLGQDLFKAMDADTLVVIDPWTSFEYHLSYR